MFLLHAIIPTIALSNLPTNIKPEYDPLLGYIGYRTGLIYNMRFYGWFQRGNKPVYDQSTDALWNLIKILFPSPTGQLTTESTHKGNFGRYIRMDDGSGPQIIAKLLAYAQSFETSRKESNGLKEELVVYAHNNTEATNRLQEELVTYLASSPLFPGADENDSTTAMEAIRTTVGNLLGYIREANTIEKSNMPCTVEHVLLTFLWMHFNSENDLEKFYQNFAEFTDSPSAEMKTLKQYFGGLQSENNPYVDESLIQNGNAKLYDRIQNQFSDVTFADCTETVLRHLLTLVFYNPKTRTYDTSSVSNQAVRDFFSTLANPNDGSVGVRSKFNAIVADLEDPNILYVDHTDGTQRNNLMPGILNIMRVLIHVFGLADFGPKIEELTKELGIEGKALGEEDIRDISQATQEKIKTVFSEILWAIQPSKEYMIIYNGASVRTNHTGGGIDFYGDLTIDIEPKRQHEWKANPSIKLSMDLSSSHAKALLDGDSDLQERKLPPFPMQAANQLAATNDRYKGIYLLDRGVQDDLKQHQMIQWGALEKNMKIPSPLEEFRWPTQTPTRGRRLPAMDLPLFYRLFFAPLQDFSRRIQFLRTIQKSSDAIYTQPLGNVLSDIDFFDPDTYNEVSGPVLSLAQTEVFGDIIRKKVQALLVPYGNEFKQFFPQGLGTLSLENMTALESIHIPEIPVKEIFFGNNPKLRSVTLINPYNVKGLGGLHALEKLRIHGNKKEKLLGSENKSLTELTLWNSSTMLDISTLPALRYLSLHKVNLERSIVLSSPTLEVLELDSGKNFQLGSLPNLRTVRFTNTSDDQPIFENSNFLKDRKLDLVEIATGRLHELDVPEVNTVKIGWAIIHKINANMAKLIIENGSIDLIEVSPNLKELVIENGEVKKLIIPANHQLEKLIIREETVLEGGTIYPLQESTVMGIEGREYIDRIQDKEIYEGNTPTE